MPRLNTVTVENAASPAKEMLIGINEKYGMVPNAVKGIANSAPALQSFIGLVTPMENFSLDAQEREIIALTASQYNGCEYCLAAHTGRAVQAGLTEEETINVRCGKPSNAKHKTLVDFTKGLIDTKGSVSEDELTCFKDAGYTDGSVAEVVAIIAYKTFPTSLTMPTKPI